MSILKETKNHELIIANGDKLVIIDLIKDQVKEIHLPDVVLPANLTKGQQDVLKSETRQITSISESNCGQFHLVSTQNKQIVVYNNNYDVIRNITLNRTASRTRFTLNNEILIADKTGDAFLCRIDDDKPPELLLGHLSMLLDILVTDCIKFLITCDRDEKIRVSHYPNAYNIQSYCLGHREFVTNVEVVKNVLISASGDGTIRLWDFENGMELYAINTNELISDNRQILIDFCKRMDGDNVEVKELPIKCMQIYHLESNVLYAAIMLLNINSIHIYEIRIGEPIKHRVLQTISLQEQILTFNLAECLYISTVDGVRCYKLLNGVYQESKNMFLSRFNVDYKSLFSRCLVSDSISVLYKRKFDNVQEYLERKKLRLQGK